MFSASLAPSTAAFFQGLEGFVSQVVDALNCTWQFSMNYDII